MTTTAEYSAPYTITPTPSLASDDRKIPNVAYFNNTICPDIYVRDGHPAPASNCTIDLLTTWRELTTLLEQDVEFVIVHIDTIEKLKAPMLEFVNTIESLTKLMPRTNPLHMGVVITKNTSLKVVTDLQKTSVTGVLLDGADYNITDVRAAFTQFLEKNRYWPKHIIKQLPGNIKKVTSTGIRLTDRQQEVLSLICNRGLSNKQIAKTLSITESTVKIHISAIMKVYAVKNRTQLVLASTSALRA